MTDKTFQDIVDQIKDFYQDHDYDLGWRFFTCSKTVLKNNPKIALITLNPVGLKNEMTIRQPVVKMVTLSITNLGKTKTPEKVSYKSRFRRCSGKSAKRRIILAVHVNL